MVLWPVARASRDPEGTASAFQGLDTGENDRMRGSPVAASRAWMIAFLLGLFAQSLTSAAAPLRSLAMRQQQCARVSDSVWVLKDGRGDCIRYYSSGLKEENPIVLVFFHGDLMPKRGGRGGLGGWSDSQPEVLRSHMRQVSHRLDIPVIFVARPGVFGSSGDHAERRRPREVELMNLALDELKKRHNIERFALAGQSSGGHLVGAMLSNRSDIKCAATASGVVAVRARARAHGWSADATGYRDFYDPIDHVDEIAESPDLTIFVIGDEKDSNVPFRTQKMYFDKLIKRGLNAHLIRAKGSGPQHHGLAHCGIRIAGLCAQNRDATETINIVRASKSYCAL
jgi:dienelactone hydrolase